ncbi:solute carrier family 2, facilitated glucose transporter member 5 [Bombina bombina]|uniref:solute carrier family 2, facilitated glucose transporter member 5 n=1 Tax=Bombina bombina TaxID=8345 RepID=UPI00235ACFA3|nr:solute carrier family 2, facilitated glucose transporter member 5 [Bombina bombina]
MVSPPGRPIVSAMGSILQPIAQFVDYYLQPMVRDMESFLRDSSMLLDCLSTISCTDKDLLVTLDVTSLYTVIPHHDGMEATRQHLLHDPYVGPPVEVHYRGLFLMIFSLGIGGTFQYGFHISVLTSPSPFIKNFINSTWIHRYNNPISDSALRILWSCIVSGYCIGGIVGTAGSGYFSSIYGKKRSQLYSNLIPLVAAMLISCSKFAKSFEMILISRILYGINAGIGLNLHPQQAAEIAPKNLRGFTNTTISIFVTAGKLFGQIFGLREVLGAESQWPLLLAMSGVWSLVQLVTLPFFPESPPYLLMEKNDKEGCVTALKTLWGDRDHQSQIDEMLKEQAARKSKRNLSVQELLWEPSLRWQLYTLIALTIALQLCGVNAIYFYASEVFLAAKFPLTQIPYLTVGVGVCETFSVILSSLLVDRFGRRILLLLGYLVMVLSLALLTVSISLQERFHWLPICSVMLIFLFVISFGTGPGSTTVTVIAEMFTQESRAAAFTLVGVINWIGLLAIGMIFPFVEASMGQYCFLIFLVVIAGCGIFLFFFLPETKGKSWLEIRQDFDKLNLTKQQSTENSKSPSKDFVVSTKL